MKNTCLTFIFSCLSFWVIAQTNANTTILQAIQANDLPQVKALVAAGADVNTQDENKATALMWAAYKGDLEMVQYLVTQGADYTQKGVIYLNDEKTAYYGNLTGIAAGEGKLELLKYLIEELGIDVDDKEYNPEEDADTGWTALQWAVNEKHEEIAIFLMEERADYQLSFNNNWTTLHYAARSNLLALTQRLLTKNVEVNIQTIQGWTSLMLAVYNGHLQMCKLLYENGADINIKDEEGKTAYDLAKENGHTSTVNFLSSPKEYILNQSLMDAAKAGDTAQIALAIKKGAHVNFTDEDGGTALHYATRDNKSEVVQLLLTHEAGINKQSNHGFTPLMFAAYNGYLQLCKSLIEQGANTTLKDAQNKTAANHAQEKGYKLLAAYLKDPTIDITGTPWKELNDSFVLYYQKGDYDKSLDFAERAYQRTQEEFSETNASYGISLNNLAVLYKSMGRYSEAEPLYKEALQNAETALGKAHPEYGTRLNNLAVLYIDMGRYPEAEPLLKEALQNVEATLGKDHPDYGARLNNLAALYKSMGRYSEAEPLYKQALQNAETALGKDHPEYGNYLNNLATLYESMGRYSEAEPLLKQALQVTETALGKEDRKSVV